MESAERITTYLNARLGRELHQLCRSRRAVKSRVIAEAIREYLDSRRADPSLGLAARAPRRDGRPSLVELSERTRQEATMAKRVGRPLSARTAEVA